ncbi:hypothetical protein [Burkholderia sp. Ac-20365]|uniref:hypothetical protein n=1 Tax=Burkholderia sp. Ac-20365 TaxID=2703897 RepID=UPI00197B22CD|nr:hypothetical protein [Burkholderia sp. Ac-20365]
MPMSARRVRLFCKQHSAAQAGLAHGTCFVYRKLDYVKRLRQACDRRRNELKVKAEFLSRALAYDNSENIALTARPGALMRNVDAPPVLQQRLPGQLRFGFARPYRACDQQFRRAGKRAQAVDLVRGVLDMVFRFNRDDGHKRGPQAVPGGHLVTQHEIDPATLLLKRQLWRSRHRGSALDDRPVDIRPCLHIVPVSRELVGTDTLEALREVIEKRVPNVRWHGKGT